MKVLSPLPRLISRFYKSILVITIVLTVIAVVFISHLRLDLNLFSLLPEHNPSTQSFFEVTEKIGFQSLLIALVHIPEDVNRAKAQAFVDFFAKHLAASSLIHDVEYKIDPEKQVALSLSFLKQLPLLLDDQGLRRLSIKLSREEIRKQVQENKRLLMTPFGSAAKSIIRADPLGLRDIFMPDLSGSPERQTIRSFRGYYRTKDEKTYILFMKPVKPPQDVVFSRNLMAEVSRIEDQAVMESLHNLDRLPEQEAVTVSYTGGYPIVLSDEAITKKDIQVTLLTSFFGVMILFGLSFRTPKVLLFVGIPLVISLLWTLGFAQIVFHDLNILTCIFSCVLIGLGIDFAIHIVNRYYHQDMVNQDMVTRLDRTFQDAGMGIIIGGITTAAAFYAIAVSDFRGFKELGILTGTGILFCIINMIFVLPSLLVYFSDKRTMPTYIPIAGFGLRSVLDLLQRYPKWVMTMVLIAFIGFVVLGRNIRFDENLRNFRPADEKVFHSQDTVTRWLGGSTDEILLVTQGPTEVEVVETTATIYRALGELKSTGSSLVGIKSITRYIPPPSQQMKNITFIRQHPGLFDVNRIIRDFNQALEENGFQQSPMYHAYFTNLAAAFSVKTAVLPSSIAENEFTRFMKMFFFKSEGSYKTITYISPAKDLWLRTDINALKTMVSDKIAEQGIGPDRYHFTGANFLTGELKTLIIKNLKSSMALAVLSIIVILFLFYRSVIFFVLSAIPLVIGLGALLGIMALFHLDFNFINLIVLPMIVGIGIDDGVHLTNTFRQTPQEDLKEAMSRTGRAVILTTLTTLVGFGSIILSHYPGLRSMGYVAVIGISACMVVSVLVYAPLFEWIRGRKDFD